MMGVGMALTANYFGVSTILTSWDPQHEQSQKVRKVLKDNLICLQCIGLARFPRKQALKSDHFI